MTKSQLTINEVIYISKNPLNLNKTKRLTYHLFQEFVDDILDNIHEENFGTFQRMKGMLAVISEFFNFRQILFFLGEKINLFFQAKNFFF